MGSPRASELAVRPRTGGITAYGLDPHRRSRRAKAADAPPALRHPLPQLVARITPRPASRPHRRRTHRLVPIPSKMALDKTPTRPPRQSAVPMPAMRRTDPHQRPQAQPSTHRTHAPYSPRRDDQQRVLLRRPRDPHPCPTRLGAAHPLRNSCLAKGVRTPQPGRKRERTAQRPRRPQTRLVSRLRRNRSRARHHRPRHRSQHLARAQRTHGRQRDNRTASPTTATHTRNRREHASRRTQRHH